MSLRLALFLILRRQKTSTPVLRLGLEEQVCIRLCLLHGLTEENLGRVLALSHRPITTSCLPPAPKTQVRQSERESKREGEGETCVWQIRKAKLEAERVAPSDCADGPSRCQSERLGIGIGACLGFLGEIGFG